MCLRSASESEPKLSELESPHRNTPRNDKKRDHESVALPVKY